MSPNVLRRTTGRISVLLAAGALLALALANPALAVTNQATAQAAQVTLLGGSVLTTNTCTAANGQPATGTCSPNAVVLPGQNLLSAAVLVQSASDTATNSSACAGAVGTGGGIIQVGPNLSCSPGAPGGITLLPTTLLGGLLAGPALLSADAIFATCNSAVGVAPSGSATIANLRLGTSTLANGTPGPNTTINLAGLATLVLNEQSTAADGTLTVTALRLTLLPTANLLGLDLSALGLGTLLGGALASGVPGAEVIVGRVSCSPKALAPPPVPLIPVAGLPFAAATLAVVGAGVMVVRRRRSSTSVSV